MRLRFDGAMRSGQARQCGLLRQKQPDAESLIDAGRPRHGLADGRFSLEREPAAQFWGSIVPLAEFGGLGMSFNICRGTWQLGDVGSRDLALTSPPVTPHLLSGTERMGQKCDRGYCALFYFH
jgi:hypothetical protein